MEAMTTTVGTPVCENPSPIISQKTFSIYSSVLSIVVYICTFIVLFSQVGFAVVPSLSMYPTLDKGSTFLYEHINYKDIEYDDIVVFFPHASLDEPISNGLEALVKMKTDDDVVYVKRVIGLPGDTLEMKGSYLYRNGEQLDPDYIAEPMNEDYWSCTVPEGKIFCMGDNRNNSMDSRYFGAFPEENFFGRLIRAF